jgi:Mg2+/Co2+ transporter CorC
MRFKVLSADSRRLHRLQLEVQKKDIAETEE